MSAGPRLQCEVTRSTTPRQLATQRPQSRVDCRSAALPAATPARELQVDQFDLARVDVTTQESAANRRESGGAVSRQKAQRRSLQRRIVRAQKAAPVQQNTRRARRGSRGVHGCHLVADDLAY